MSAEVLDYPSFLQDALRGLVRRCLETARDEGLPGDHHFYVGFRTDHPAAGVADFLRNQYPEEMTIVLQHEFRDLEVDETSFAVTLRFGGTPARLFVPFAALTSFVDPSVEFGLRFTPDLSSESEHEVDESSPSTETLPSEPGGRVVAFDPARVR